MQQGYPAPQGQPMPQQQQQYAYTQQVQQQSQYQGPPGSTVQTSQWPQHQPQQQQQWQPHYQPHQQFQSTGSPQSFALPTSQQSYQPSQASATTLSYNPSAYGAMPGASQLGGGNVGPVVPPKPQQAQHNASQPQQYGYQTSYNTAQSHTQPVPVSPANYGGPYQGGQGQPPAPSNQPTSAPYQSALAPQAQPPGPAMPAYQTTHTLTTGQPLPPQQEYSSQPLQPSDSGNSYNNGAAYSKQQAVQQPVSSTPTSQVYGAAPTTAPGTESYFSPTVAPSSFHQMGGIPPTPGSAVSQSTLSPPVPLPTPHSGLTPSENSPAYVSPSLSGQGVAAYIPANTNPAPGVYIPKPPTDVPAWTPASNTALSSGTGRFKYTKPTNSIFIQDYASMQQPAIPPSFDSNRPMPGAVPVSGANTEMGSQYWQAPAIPQQQTSLPQTTPPMVSQNNSSHHNSISSISSVTPSQSTLYGQNQQYPVPSRSSSHRPSDPISPLLQRQSIALTDASQLPPDISQYALKRTDTGKTTSSRSSISRKATATDSPKPQHAADRATGASALGGYGGPSDWEHYQGASELPSEDLSPPSTPINETSKVNVIPRTPTDEFQPAPPPLNIRKTASPVHIHEFRSELESEPATSGLNKPPLVGDAQTSEGMVLSAEPVIAAGPSEIVISRHQNSSEQPTPSTPISSSVPVTSGNVSPAEATPPPMSREETCATPTATVFGEPEQLSRTISSVRLSDAAPDLDPWYLASLERYLIMVRQESAENDVEKKQQIFKKFLSNEATSRSINVEFGKPSEPSSNSLTTVEAELKSAKVPERPTITAPSRSESQASEGASSTQYSPGGRPIIRPNLALAKPHPVRSVSPLLESENRETSHDHSRQRIDTFSSVNLDTKSQREPSPHSGSPKYRPYRNSLTSSDALQPAILTPGSSTAGETFKLPLPTEAVKQSEYRPFSPAVGNPSSPAGSGHLRRTSGSNSRITREEHREIFFDPEHDEAFERQGSRSSPLRGTSPSKGQHASSRELSGLVAASIAQLKSSKPLTHPKIQACQKALNSSSQGDKASSALGNPEDAIQQLHGEYIRNIAHTRGRLARERSQHSQHHQAMRQAGMGAPQTGGPIGDEKANFSAEIGDEFATFQDNVFTPIYNLLEDHISRLTTVSSTRDLVWNTSVGLAGLCATESTVQSTDKRASGSGESLSLLCSLTIYAACHKAIERHQALQNAMVAARDRMYARAELARALSIPRPTNGTLADSLHAILTSLLPTPSTQELLDGTVIAILPQPSTDNASPSARAILSRFRDSNLASAVKAATSSASSMKEACDTIQQATQRGLDATIFDLDRLASAVSDSSLDATLCREAVQPIHALDRQTKALFVTCRQAELSSRSAALELARACATRDQQPRTLQDAEARVGRERGEAEKKFGQYCEALERAIQRARQALGKAGYAVAERESEAADRSDGLRDATSSVDQKDGMDEETLKKERLRIALEEARKRNREV